MARFKLSTLTIALAAAGCVANFLPTYAYAQEAEVSQQVSEKEKDNAEAKKEENKITVTGSYTGSLIRSLEEKRNADVVSEQLSADDIGALPDMSIADALTRLPGISAVRTGGQAAEINIRGLSGIFIFSTLNGREQVATSGSRSIDFDQYPSELIASGSVYKSQKASLIEGGVAGSVELRTASALSNTEQHTFGFNARAVYNDRASGVYDADKWGERLSFTYQGKFADDTIGFSFGIAQLTQPSVAEQFIGLNFNTEKDLDGVSGDTEGSAACPQCEFISEGMELQHKGGTEDRTSYVAAFEWAPNADFKLTADYFRSEFKSEQWARGLRVKFGGNQANYYFPTLVDNSMVGGVVARTANSFTRVEIANDDDSETDISESIGVKGEWQLNEAFSLSADLSHSSGKSDFQNRLLWSLVAEDATVADPTFDTNVVINYEYSGLDIPSVGFNQDFTNPNTLMASKYGTYPYLYDDRVNAFRVDGIYELFNNDYVRSFEFGLRASERQWDATRKVFEYGDDGGFSIFETPFQLQPGMYNVVNWGGDFAHFPSYLAINIDQVLSAWLPNGMGTPLTTWGTDVNGNLDYSSAWSVQGSGSVFEDILAAYFMANLDFEVSDINVTGNVGLRVVNSDQSATRLRYIDETLSDEERAALGAQWIVDEAGLASFRYARDMDGTNYTDYLPSLNLNFHLTDDTQLRFAAARVMARPEINRLASNFNGTVGLNPNRTVEHPEPYVFNGSEFNSPRLKPFLADQYDLSWEYYFDDQTGGISVAVFYKDIKNFVDQGFIERFDFTSIGVPVPDTYINPLSGVPSDVGLGSFSFSFNNDKPASLKGFEFATTMMLDELPSFWSGLGFNFNYAYTESSATRRGSEGVFNVETAFPGLSRHVASGTIFYTGDRFETRLSTRYRSEFISQQWGVNEQTVNFDDETVMDYQASYDFDSGVRMLFQINNLTDQPTKSYFFNEARTGTIQFFGRQYYLGLNYKF